MQNINVTLDEKKLCFVADGQGARGPNKYGFVINLHSPINPEVKRKEKKALIKLF